MDASILIGLVGIAIGVASVAGVAVGALVTWLVARHYFEEAAADMHRLMQQNHDRTERMLQNVGLFLQQIAAMDHGVGTVEFHLKSDGRPDLDLPANITIRPT